MKFLADMGISQRTVAWLRNQEHDCTHLYEEGLARLTDQAILSKAFAEERVLLTLDVGFSQLIAASGAALPSIILFRLGNRTSQVVTARLADVLAQFNAELQSGAMISVSETLIRVRRLPINPQTSD